MTRIALGNETARLPLILALSMISEGTHVKVSIDNISATHFITISNCSQILAFASKLTYRYKHALNVYEFVPFIGENISGIEIHCCFWRGCDN